MTAPIPRQVTQLVEPYGNAAWAYSFSALEEQLTSMGLPHFEVRPGPVKTILGRALGRLGLVRNLRHSADIAVLVPLMGLNQRRVFPFCYTHEVIPIILDCWPRDYARWTRFLKANRIRVAFFSARQNAEHFQRELSDTECYWFPEAVDPMRYHQGDPLRDRRIDVLELGRRSIAFHERSKPVLATHGVSHLFEPLPGRMIFSTFKELTLGLCESKISVCFPASVTHPQRAGRLETVTLRYFESIASGCLLFGQCPSELIDLFGYNPGVEVDLECPGEHVLKVIEEIETYQDLVDRNYRRLLEVGTLPRRVQTLVAYLEHHGYQTVPL